MVLSPNITYGDKVVAVTGASALTLLAAVASTKHRIFLLSITADTAGLITIADMTTPKCYLPANGSYVFDFGALGLKQGTANTAITLTNSGGGNLSAYAIYSEET